MKKTDIISVKKKLAVKSGFFSSVEEIHPCQSLNVFIFLGTEVKWDEDGSYTTKELEADIYLLNQKGYYQIFLTSIMPLKVCQNLYAHYYPLDVCPSKLGLNLQVSFDMEELHFLFQSLNQQHLQVVSLEKLEMMVLVKTCENCINQSFYQEMELFCRKKNIPFFNVEAVLSRLYHKKNTRLILEYMIREMEDAEIDCPLLFSCLFRQKYLGFS